MLLLLLFSSVVRRRRFVCPSIVFFFSLSLFPSSIKRQNRVRKDPLPCSFSFFCSDSRSILSIPCPPRNAKKKKKKTETKAKRGRRKARVCFLSIDGGCVVDGRKKPNKTSLALALALALSFDSLSKNRFVRLSVSLIEKDQGQKKRRAVFKRIKRRSSIR